MLKNVMGLTKNSVTTLLVVVFSSVVSGAPAMAQNMATTNDYWWPNRLNLKPLRDNSPESNPLGSDFNYAEEFEKLDLDAVKRDLEILMTSSQDWCRQTMAIMAHCLFAWPGTALVPTGSVMVAEVAMAACSALHHSTAGPTTRTWSRRVN